MNTVFIVLMAFVDFILLFFFYVIFMLAQTASDANYKITHHELFGQKRHDDSPIHKHSSHTRIHERRHTT